MRFNLSSHPLRAYQTKYHEFQLIRVLVHWCLTSWHSDVKMSLKVPKYKRVRNHVILELTSDLLQGPFAFFPISVSTHLKHHRLWSLMRCLLSSVLFLYNVHSCWIMGNCRQAQQQMQIRSRFIYNKIFTFPSKLDRPRLQVLIISNLLLNNWNIIQTCRKMDTTTTIATTSSSRPS